MGNKQSSTTYIQEGEEEVILCPECHEMHSGGTAHCHGKKGGYHFKSNSTKANLNDPPSWIKTDKQLFVNYEDAACTKMIVPTEGCLAIRITFTAPAYGVPDYRFMHVCQAPYFHFEDAQDRLKSFLTHIVNYLYKLVSEDAKSPIKLVDVSLLLLKSAHDNDRPVAEIKNIINKMARSMIELQIATYHRFDLTTKKVELNAAVPAQVLGFSPEDTEEIKDALIEAFKDIF